MEQQSSEKTPEQELALSIMNGSASANIAVWADDKKKDFLKTFRDRLEVSAYILQATANEVGSRALRRKFISNKHLKQIEDSNFAYTTRVHPSWNATDGRIGGRLTTELDKIASEKADEILKNLPVLKDAVKIIDVATFKLIEEHKALEDTLNKNQERMDELCQEIVMSDVDQKMTVGDFVKYVKKVAKDKRDLREDMLEKGKRLQKLDETISKNLYAGIPGISEAIVKIVNEYNQRVTGMEALSRRVEERVKFGNSPEALSMLETFEKDEVQLSTNIKAEFDIALEKLNLAKKKLAKGKK